MAVWSELWNSILQARLDQMGWNLKWFIFELFLTEIVNDFLIKTANFKMWFYAVSKMLHLTLTLCLSLASQQMAFFPICILPCLWFAPKKPGGILRARNCLYWPFFVDQNLTLFTLCQFVTRRSHQRPFYHFEGMKDHWPGFPKTP